MKNLFIFLTVLISLYVYLSVIPKISLAHVLQYDGSIGATLHIDPDDDPVAGEQSNFFFDFKDKQNKFSAQNCNCTMTVVEDGKTLVSLSMSQLGSDPTSLSVYYTFPQKDIYTLKINGTPTVANAFQAFNLSYDIRVAKESAKATNPNSAGQNSPSWLSTHIPHVVGGILVGLFLIFALVKQTVSKPKSD